MRVALVYNEPLPSRYHALGEEVAIISVMESVQSIEEVLLAKGHQVERLGLRPPLSGAVKALEGLDADLIFNLFEGFDGHPETEWLVAGALALLGRPFTGASPLTLALCQNKARAKQLMVAHGIPTASFQLLHPNNVAEFALEFPVIVKPLQEDGSHGLSADSVVHDLPALARQVQVVTERYGTPALVETYLAGREFNAAVLGSQSPRLLPPSEMVYSPEMPYPKILTYAAKWHYETLDFQASTANCPAPVSEAMRQELDKLALAAHGALGAPPYARVDLRADGQGRLHVLEVNPNPDLGPETGIALQSFVAGMQYGELIQTIMDLALEEKGAGNRMTACQGSGSIPQASKKPNFSLQRNGGQGDEGKRGESLLSKGGLRGGTGGLGEVTLRPMHPEDVAGLVQIVRDTGFFRLDEVAAAQEVLEDCVTKGESSGYYVHVAEESEKLLGWVCFGPTPLTLGTWDLYWIAVAPDHQGRGIGTRLMCLAEEEICRQGGRLVLVETSSQELYTPTRRFYDSLGYREVSRILDFYDLGDAKVTYAKVMLREVMNS